MILFYLSIALKHWKDVAIGLLVVVLVASCHARDVSIRERGAALERARVADSTIAALKPQLARVDTVYQRDTVRVRVAVDRVVTLRDTLMTHLTDTLLVKEYVTAADSTVKACRDLVTDCTTQKALLTADRDAWKAKALAVPGARSDSHLLSNLLWGAIGAGLGHFIR